MKHLKKFSSLKEYERYIASDEFVKPNVSLVEESDAIFYHGVIPNGVYIQHTDGTVYQIEEWTSKGFSSEEANGVAIIDDLASFVIAKEDAGTGLKWSNTAELIEGVSASDSSSKLVYSGANDTRILVELGVSPAAQACADYTFPNGAKGYMPSVGEWKVLHNNATKVQEALTLIGGANMFNKNSARYYWSSTQYNDSKAWAWASRMDIQEIAKSTLDDYSGYTRAICAL